ALRSPARSLSAVRLSELSLRRDVLVHAEEVVWVVALLHFPEPVPRPPGVRRADALGAFVAEEVDVRAIVTLAKRFGESLHPRLVDTCLVRRCVDGCEVDHDPS